MYLRITERRNRDGSTVAYYALAENVWNAQRLKIFPPLRLVTCNPLIRQLESPRLGLVKVT